MDRQNAVGRPNEMMGRQSAMGRQNIRRRRVKETHQIINILYHVKNKTIVLKRNTRKVKYLKVKNQ